ncbi:hypothetical protein N658DRAFT_85547 [Parathielavia hyrcaniae]|uniref:Uncharacterized protein n=1 Tax=Parathielavia hyrcaniae TaxID=113614 RepID=A0AAN6PZS7_9PEZI|nr:hypothetical protein N658DRAFT_85547 [Parathielavia hyrcaniae]
MCLSPLCDAPTFEMTMPAWWAQFPRQRIQIGPPERFARHGGLVDQKASLALGGPSIWEEGRPGTPVLGLSLERSREAGGKNTLDPSRYLMLGEKAHRPRPGQQALTTWSDILGTERFANARHHQSLVLPGFEHLGGLGKVSPHASGFCAMHSR